MEMLRAEGFTLSLLLLVFGLEFSRVLISLLIRFRDMGRADRLGRFG